MITEKVNDEVLDNNLLDDEIVTLEERISLTEEYYKELTTDKEESTCGNCQISFPFIVYFPFL